MDGVYSLDKLVIWLKVKTVTVNEIGRMLEFGASDIYGVLMKSFVGKSPGLCGLNYSIAVEDEESYYLGIGRYGAAPNEYWVECKVEFNPAKVDKSKQFTALYDRLLANAKYVEFKRFDVAIDYPEEREKFFLLKDQRVCNDKCYSLSNRTTYLGVRSSHGQIKLYNKQLESKLDYPLTRLEMTLDYAKASWSEFRRMWPKVYCVMGPPPDDLQGVDRVLVMAVIEHPDYIMHLPYKKHKKIEQLIETAAQKLMPSEINYKIILQQILEYGKGLPLGTFEELEDMSDVFEPELEFEADCGEQEKL